MVLLSCNNRGEQVQQRPYGLKDWNICSLALYGKCLLIPHLRDGWAREQSLGLCSPLCSQPPLEELSDGPSSAPLFRRGGLEMSSWSAGDQWVSATRDKGKGKIGRRPGAQGRVCSLVLSAIQFSFWSLTPVKMSHFVSELQISHHKSLCDSVASTNLNFFLLRARL